MPNLSPREERDKAVDGRYPMPPCPFCGTSEWDSSRGWVPFKSADDRWIQLATNGVGGWAVECAGCKLATGEFGSAKAAMDAWARRSPVRVSPTEGKRLCTGRLAPELFEQMVRQGHVFTQGDTLTVTEGLPEDARLIGVRFERDPAPIIYLEYEHTSGDIPDGEEIVVEFTAQGPDSKALDACRAALAYDAAIQEAAKSQADENDSWTGSDDLDRLYVEWITRAREAVADDNPTFAPGGNAARGEEF